MNRAAAALGRKGGKAGRGKSKVRGSAAYYRALALLAAARRKANKDKLEAQREPQEAEEGK